MKNLNYRLIGMIIFLTGFVLALLGIFTGDFTGYWSTTGLFSKVAVYVETSGIFIATASAIVETFTSND